MKIKLEGGQLLKEALLSLGKRLNMTSMSVGKTKLNMIIAQSKLYTLYTSSSVISGGESNRRVQRLVTAPFVRLPVFPSIRQKI
jgi:hypothetical protein